MQIILGPRTLPETYDWLVNLKVKSKDNLTIGLALYPIFHSKIYIFYLEKKTITIIGSSNLTEPALTNSNIETNIELENCPDIEERFKVSFEHSEKTHKEIINQLRKLEKNNRRQFYNEREAKEEAEGIVEGQDSAKQAKKFRILLEKLNDPVLVKHLKQTWRQVDHEIDQSIKDLKVKRSKKAWARKRLIHVLSKGIADKRNYILEKIFQYTGEFSVAETLGKEFLLLDKLLEIIIANGLERIYTNAYFCEKSRKKRLFKKITDELKKRTS